MSQTSSTKRSYKRSSNLSTFAVHFSPHRAEVPVVQAQSIRLGEYSESASVPKGVQLSSGKSWKHNCSRQAWQVFKRKGLGWDVKLSSYNYLTASGDVLSIAYISPCDLIPFLMKNHPGVLVGGLPTVAERALHLKTFWEGFRLANKNHEVFQEHNDNLERVLPLFWHGDEGRGKRRGNTVVVSCETVFGTNTVLNSRKRTRDECDCNPGDSLKQRFAGRPQQTLTPEQLKILGMQATTMKGHSLLHHWPLFIIPSSIHHAHPGALLELLKVLAGEFRKLFYEGFFIGSTTYNAAIIGAKGDLKWFGKIALQRSWENQGRIRDIACCHMCMGGQPNIHWEDVASNTPVWAPTRFTQRPWQDAPATLAIPFERGIPEKQYKLDPFHLMKVGIFRDVCGSVLCYLVAKGFFGQQGTFDTKLSNAHSGFILYCRTVGRTPALRTFTRRLLMLPRLDAYPWSNTKGSDTMLILDWLQVQLVGFEVDPIHPSYVPTLKLMRKTCKAARGLFHHLNHHGLWHTRKCSMCLFAEVQGFIQGYVALAGRLLNDSCSGFAIKPKLHLLRHCSLEIQECLEQGHQCQLSLNAVNCEADEDLVGRVCRLSRRLDSRKIGERVLGCCLLKSHILYTRFKKLHKL